MHERSHHIAVHIKKSQIVLVKKIQILFLFITGLYRIKNSIFHLLLPFHKHR